MPSTKGLQPHAQRGLAVILDFLRGLGYSARYTSGYRSSAKQAQLYRAWKEGRSPFPANPPGVSAHEHGLAVDVVSDAPEQFLEWAGRLAGLPWLGRRDRVHFGPPSVRGGFRRGE